MPSEPYRVDIHREDNKVVVEISGEIDAFFHPDLERLPDQIGTKVDVVVLELSDLQFIDSVGIWSTEKMRTRFEERGVRVELRHPPHVMERLAQLLAIHL